MTSEARDRIHEAASDGEASPGTTRASTSGLEAPSGSQGQKEEAKNSFLRRLRSSPKTQFWTGFWSVIILLILLYSFAQFLIWRNNLLQAVYVNSPLEITSKALNSEIDKLVDEVYEPVYKQIPALSEYHYSLKGEYKDLYNAILGNAERSVKEILFDKIDFDERMNKALDKLDVVAVSTLHARLRENLPVREVERQFLSKALGINKEDVN